MFFSLESNQSSSNTATNAAMPSSMMARSASRSTRRIWLPLPSSTIRTRFSKSCAGKSKTDWTEQWRMPIRLAHDSNGCTRAQWSIDRRHWSATRQIQSAPSHVCVVYLYSKIKDVPPCIQKAMKDKGNVSISSIPQELSKLTNLNTCTGDTVCNEKDIEYFKNVKNAMKEEVRGCPNCPNC